MPTLLAGLFRCRRLLLSFLGLYTFEGYWDAGTARPGPCSSVRPQPTRTPAQTPVSAAQQRLSDPGGVGEGGPVPTLAGSFHSRVKASRTCGDTWQFCPRANELQ